MEHVKNLLLAMSERLKKLASANAVVARPISVGDRHVIPLCELGLAFGGGGGRGEMDNQDGPQAAHGSGGGAGGGAKATPVAVLVVEDGKVRLERLGH